MSATPATTQAHAPERQAIPLSLFGMILFISSEVMFFGGFFGAYFDLRSGYKIWPPPLPHIEQIELWPIPLILTVVLVTSSFTMQAGLSAIKQGDVRGLRRWLKVTIGLGAIFLMLQLYDYSRLGFGIKDGVYATMFYTMTGFHFAHVFGGALFLYVILLQSYQGEFSAQEHTGVEAGTLYWHFVDIVWIGLFSTFYLLR